MMITGKMAAKSRTIARTVLVKPARRRVLKPVAVVVPWFAVATIGGNMRPIAPLGRRV